MSAPGFNSANSPSWIWAGIYKAADTPANYRNITWGGHLCSFARGYTTSQGLYKRINSLLYNMIPDTDVRKDGGSTPASNRRCSTTWTGTA